MSKLHITLAENMSRFGTKNLTESNKRALRYLAEQGEVKKTVVDPKPGVKPKPTLQKPGAEDMNFVHALQQASALPIPYETPPIGTDGEFAGKSADIRGTGTVYKWEKAPKSNWSYLASLTPDKPQYINSLYSELFIDTHKAAKPKQITHMYKYLVGYMPKLNSSNRLGNAANGLSSFNDSKPVYKTYTKIYPCGGGTKPELDKVYAELTIACNALLTDGPQLQLKPNISEATFQTKMKSLGYSITAGAVVAAK